MVSRSAEGAKYGQQETKVVCLFRLSGGMNVPIWLHIASFKVLTAAKLRISHQSELFQW
jgi:hypothetical protein